MNLLEYWIMSKTAASLNTGNPRGLKGIITSPRRWWQKRKARKLIDKKLKERTNEYKRKARPFVDAIEDHPLTPEIKRQLKNVGGKAGDFASSGAESAIKAKNALKRKAYKHLALAPFVAGTAGAGGVGLGVSLGAHSGKRVGEALLGRTTDQRNEKRSYDKLAANILNKFRSLKGRRQMEIPENRLAGYRRKFSEGAGRLKNKVNSGLDSLGSGLTSAGRKIRSTGKALNTTRNKVIAGVLGGSALMKADDYYDNKLVYDDGKKKKKEKVKNKIVL